MTTFKTYKFPRTRIATMDVCTIGKQKHHVSALLELDVTLGREKLKSCRKESTHVSFTAWLIKVISLTVKEHENVAAYLAGKRKLMIFEDVDVSFIVEKELNGQKVPIPLMIEKANERSLTSITAQIREAKQKELDAGEIVLQKKTERAGRLYYLLPGFLRRLLWRYLLQHPRLAYSKMGNVAITSVGAIGKVNAWFIPVSLHPLCFGISTVLKKPVVVDDKIEIREMLNLTVLIDHDVIDGASMARFIRALALHIENGNGF